MNKKGQVSLERAPQIVLTLMFMALVAVAAAITLNGIKGSGSATGTSTLAATQSVVADNATAVTFDAAGDTLTCTGNNAYNGTRAENMTAFVTFGTSAPCTATLTNNSFDGSTLQVNYTRAVTTYTYAYNISEDGETSLDNFSNQTPTLGTVVGVALIVVVVIAAFMFLFKGGGAL